MSDEGKKVTRRRLLGGLVTVGAASAAAGAGTMALFSDTESSTGNTVQAGTLNLSFDSGGSFAFSGNLKPNETTTKSVTLVSDGSLSGSLDVDVDYTEDDGNTGNHDKTAQEFAQNLEVQTLDYDNTDLTGRIDGGSPPTLFDLKYNDQTSGEATPNDLTDLPDPGDGTTFTVGFKLKDVKNKFQGDGVAVTFDFHLNQNDSQ
ncbi:hypothetical protein Huta_1313 [Halorhabdus utahensis DSM 12940]|uniref:SipW-cognate class signal peptide n=1 Tax=Halorhabdus utahensis (strain DSM 12940 / JCM 11049 / AX-2) TaxID=519442 RepID=C7NN89_HALUD|nr:TasA family protein [Halorhabdus utahensis]ACV11489.1 hypothetical protein Huta_1313 [Halorhabdus utahensis DSM 12940]